jgi:hypothetical protein
MAIMKKMVAKKAPKKYAMGGTMTTTSETTKKPTVTGKKPTAKELKNLKDATEMKNMRSPFTNAAEWKRKKEITGMKTGGTMKKAANGTSLGMKSVKAGFDKNPGVTRADIIVAGKGKAKSGAKMKKCKYGCN